LGGLLTATVTRTLRFEALRFAGRARLDFPAPRFQRFKPACRAFKCAAESLRRFRVFFLAAMFETFR
jgi:hypothetical protein